jgi:hypothetical protein
LSWQATTWAMNADLDPVSKIILLSYADFAGEDGTGTWLTRKTMLQRVRRVSESTISRRVTSLLREGYLREGNQDALPDYWRDRPPSARPIVYDLPMDDAARQQWKDSYQPGPRRSAAAAKGAAGGRRSAEVRRGTAQAGGGATVQPPLLPLDDDAAEPQAAQGATLQPPPGPDGPLQPPGVSPGETPGGSTQVEPDTYPEPPGTRSSRAGSAPQPRHGAPAPARRQSTTRSADQQARFELADEIARGWWDYWRQQEIPVVGGFVGFRKSIVLAALDAGATAEQVQQALRACNVPFPSRGAFQAAVTAAASGRLPAARRPAAGRPQPANVHHDTDMPPAERARLASLFDGTRIRGREPRNG